MYLKAIKHFNIQPEECLIIEDSLIGVEAAYSAGIEVIAIYDQYAVHEQPEIKAKANYFFENFANLIQRI